VDGQAAAMALLTQKIMDINSTTNLVLTVIVIVAAICLGWFLSDRVIKKKFPVAYAPQPHPVYWPIASPQAIPATVPLPVPAVPATVPLQPVPVTIEPDHRSTAERMAVSSSPVRDTRL
jgi:hypothetical protein